VFWQNVRMLDEHSFTLNQVDPARADFYATEGELKAQLALLPTRKDIRDGVSAFPQAKQRRLINPATASTTSE